MSAAGKRAWSKGRWRAAWKQLLNAREKYREQQNTKGRRRFLIAGGPAVVANESFAVGPWLCVSAFRRICSEQLCVRTPVDGSISSTTSPGFLSRPDPARDDRHHRAAVIQRTKLVCFKLRPFLELPDFEVVVVD